MTSPSPAPLEVEVPARAGELAVIRRQVSGWMTLVGVPADLAAYILLVVNEACSNSIEHAYLGQSEGTVRVTAERDSDAICFTIEDFGRWRGGAADADVARGRGLPLMRALSARVDLRTSTGGTRLSMTFAP